VTATHDRQSDLDTEPAGPAWDERPIVGNVRGLPWWAAVLLAFAVAGAAAYLDVHRQGSLGRIYQAAYVTGCLIAVLWVRRRNLFGPMVQPPLIFAVTFVPVQLMFRNSTETSASKKLIFEVGIPLAGNFPWMAGATAATILLGVVRLLIQRDPNRRLSAAEDPPRRDRDGERDRERDRAGRERDGARERDRGQEDRPPRRPARDDRPREERPRDDRARRESAPRRPRDDREERPPRPAKDREDRRDRGDRGGRSSEAPPPRRNPQRPREQGGRPPQRRRPREDDHRD
jgi:hypothetical protein